MKKMQELKIRKWKEERRRNEKGNKEYHLTCQRLVPCCDTKNKSLRFEAVCICGCGDRFKAQ